MRPFSLDTPCLMLHEQRLRANAERMRQRAQRLGVTLRPHLKTTKSAAIARIATGDGPLLGTVATLRAAEYFVAHGHTDLTYAVCVTPDKLDRVAALNAGGATVHVITDQLEVARAIAAHPGRHSVLVEIDCGEHRTGLPPGSPDVVAIGRTIQAAPRAAFAGVLTHGGHSYNCQHLAQIIDVAEQERQAAVSAAVTLRQAGIECATVSVGSTPTAVHARSLDGVTEMRPGVYLLGDLFQVGLESCQLADVASWVLATVISHNVRTNQLVLDAGGLALSKDRSTRGRNFDAGYGLVVDPATGAPLGMTVTDVHQEHGEVSAQKPIDFHRYPVGCQVGVMPNHICMTAAMYECFHVIGTGGKHTCSWPRTNGWARWTRQES